MKNREEVRTFTQRGVADLYDLYQADSAFMKGAAIADKVIGKGAAALMVLAPESCRLPLRGPLSLSHCSGPPVPG